jgi:hypothetical protein
MSTRVYDARRLPWACLFGISEEVADAAYLSLTAISCHGWRRNGAWSLVSYGKRKQNMYE